MELLYILLAVTVLSLAVTAFIITITGLVWLLIFWFSLLGWN